MVIPESIRTTTADKLDGMDVVIRRGMDTYSGWAEWDHVCWLSEITGLDAVGLILLVDQGYLSRVWLVSRDYHKSKARLLWEGDDDNDE